MIDYTTWEPGQVGLYLDDCRCPRTNHYFRWVTVRSFAAFKQYILQQGVPAIISFDHDLGAEHCIIGAANDWKDFQYDICEEPTGYHAAKWLVEYCLDNDIKLPHFTVHSANPAGADNILHLLNNLQREQGQEPNGYRTVW